jgi:hypothetical protein
MDSRQGSTKKFAQHGFFPTEIRYGSGSMVLVTDLRDGFRKDPRGDCYHRSHSSGIFLKAPFEQGKLVRRAARVRESCE